MKLTVYGARGSRAAPSRKDEFDTTEFGGHTTCFDIETRDKKHHIIDAGTGISVLGDKLTPEQAKGSNLLMTHTHQDHVIGLGFFGAAYNPSSGITVHGPIYNEMVELTRPITDPALRDILSMSAGTRTILTDLAGIQQPEYFPVGITGMKGLKKFRCFVPGETVYETDTVIVSSSPLNHPGHAVSYRFTDKATDRSLVVATDFEPDYGPLDQEIMRFWRGAAVVLADGQYEHESKENPFMKGFGHSTFHENEAMAAQAGVKRLYLTHHDPKQADAYHRRLEDRARNLAADNYQGLEVALARESEVITI